MRLKLRLAVRDWDYITPLALKDVSSERLDVEVHRVGSLTGNDELGPIYDAMEMSFSRYAQLRFQSNNNIVGIPTFVMRGFRHRCIITAKSHSVSKLSELAGKNIGVTGWRDSGNIWTRAAVRREGVGIEDARWFAGRLTENHPIADRLDGYGRAGRIEAVPDERPMVELLNEGFLDAIFTPFMPQGFFEPDSLLRQVLADFRASEVQYFKEVGYVPGMHMIGLNTTFVDSNPWVISELAELLDASQKMWLQKREKYADTTPWMIDELRKCATDLPANWNASGISENQKMIEDFADELFEQKILPRKMTVAELFPRHT